MFISCSVAFFHALSYGFICWFFDMLFVNNTYMLHAYIEIQGIRSLDQSWLFFQTRFFSICPSQILDWWQQHLYFSCHKSKCCTQGQFCQVVQSAMARELLNANGISKSKALARFVPDALKQIEPFHFHSLPTVK